MRVRVFSELKIGRDRPISVVLPEHYKTNIVRRGFNTPADVLMEKRNYRKVLKIKMHNTEKLAISE